jgi:hypothetical protein
MELLNRYLQAVKRYLPGAQQDDIIKELSANLLSQMEDKEAELGRPLTESEQEAVLKQHGHPFLVASRYRRLPLQYLIGPAMFPFYWYTLLAVLAIVATINLVSSAAMVLTGKGMVAAMSDAWAGFWLGAVCSIGMVTTVFALLEYFQVKLRFLEHWNPRSLPKVVSDTQQVPRSRSIPEFIFSVIGIFVWLAIPHYERTLLVPLAGLKLGPAWHALYLPVLVLSVAKLVPLAINIVRPDWTRLRSVAHIAGAAALLGVVGYSLTAGSWVILAGSTGNAAIYNRIVTVGSHSYTVLEIINKSVAFTFILAGIITLVDSLWQASRLFLRRRKRTVAAMLA